MKGRGFMGNQVAKQLAHGTLLFFYYLINYLKEKDQVTSSSGLFWRDTLGKIIFQ